MRSLPWPLSFGQKENGRAERSLDEADSRDSNVETGKRTSRSSETRDLGIKSPQWHTLMFSDEIKIDTRLVCPKDV